MSNNWRAGVLGEPSPDEALSFIEALTGSRDTPIRIRIIDPVTGSARKLPLAPLKEHWAEIDAANLAGENIYLVINEGGDCAKDITCIRAAFVDGDGVQMPAEFHGPPSIILQRDATHWHAYWRVEDLPVQDFKPTQQRLAALYGTDPSVCDPSRVMRLPCTLHHKNGVTSPGYRIQRAAGTRYEPWELLSNLPEIASPAEPRAPSSVEGDPVTREQLAEVVSFIDPRDRDTYLVTVKVLGLGLVPMAPGHEKSPEEWLQLAEDYTSGGLWGQRVGEPGFMPTNARGEPNVSDRETLLRDIGAQDRTTGPRATFGSLYHFACVNGYAKPPVLSDPTAIKEAAQQILDATLAEPAQPATSGILRPVSVQKARRLATPLIEGFIPDGGTSVIHGTWGSYKSFIALDIALAIASGRPVFNKLKICRTGPTFYCAGEGLGGIETERRPAWCAARAVADDDSLPFYTIEAVPCANAPQSADPIIAAIKALGVRPGIVIIDTMARAMAGLKENEAGDANLYIDMVERMARELDCPVLTVAHEGKDGERGIRGSSAFPSGFDNVFGIEAEADTLTARIRSIKTKDGEREPDINLKGERVPMAGKKPGLLFNAVDADDYGRAKGKTAGITRSEVGAALKALGAVAETGGQAVTTFVLASQIAGPGSDDTTVAVKERCLRRGAKEKFASYISHHGTGRAEPTLWIFPYVPGGTDHE